MSTSIKSAPNTLIFDLDGCLYDAGCGYVEHVRMNVFKFMIKKGWTSSIEESKKIWWPLFQKYNQSKRALKMGGYEFNDDEYWSFMRSGYELYLKNDVQLQSLLSSFSNTKIKKKYIMTNCAEKQAIEALDVLGITNHFDKIYGADFMEDICKPQKEAFLKVLNDINIDNPSDVCFFEDSYKNLVTAKELGMTTVFVKGYTADEEGVSKEDELILDAIVNTLSDENGNYLKSLLPQLFD